MLWVQKNGMVKKEARGIMLTHGLVSLLLVSVVLLEQQWPSDANLSSWRPAIGVIPARTYLSSCCLSLWLDP